MSATNSGCGCGCEETGDPCSCPAGLDAQEPRLGNGVPTVQSDDRAGRFYYQQDSTPQGEVWFFNGVSWVDEGYAQQGIQGLPGQNGESIIENNQTPASTASAVLTDLDTYVMPANTLQSDGDEILIDTFFHTGASNGVKLNGIVFDASSTLIAILGVNMSTSRMQLTVTRVSATSVRLHWVNKRGNSFGFNTDSTDYYNPTPVAVADLSANPITIKTQGKSTASAESVTCNYLTVYYKHKI